MTKPQDDHRYAQRRGQGQEPVQGRDYGAVRGPEAQNPDQTIMGGENHSYGGYGSEVARHREEFGGGTAPAEVDRYAPGEAPGKGSGAGALGEGGGISRPQEEGEAPTQDSHPGIVREDGTLRRPD